MVWMVWKIDGHCLVIEDSRLWNAERPPDVLICMEFLPTLTSSLGIYRNVMGMGFAYGIHVESRSDFVAWNSSRRPFS